MSRIGISPWLLSRALPLAAALGGLLGTTESRAVEGTLIALTGTPATGVSGGNYQSFFAPGITADGTVWFSGATTLNEYSFQVEGLWKGTSAATRTLVARDLPGPTATHVAFTAYNAFLSGGGAAFYVANSGTVNSAGVAQTLFTEGTAAPGAGGAQFDFLGFGLAMNAAGTVAATHQLKGTGVNGTNASAVYAGTPGAYQLFARQGAATPGVTGGTFTGFLDLRTTPGGTVNVFVNSNTHSSATGIWQGTSAADLHQVVGGNMTAPGITGATFDNFNDASALNAAGRIAFTARVTAPGAAAKNNWGLWSDARGSLQLLARTGDLAPGTTGGLVFNQQFGYAGTVLLNNAGRVVFASSLANTVPDADAGFIIPVAGSRDSGLWTSSGGQLQLLAREGVTAAGLPANVGVGDLTFAPLAINNAGVVVFATNLVGLEYLALNNTNDAGLFTWSEASGLSLYLRKGDTIAVGAGSRTIAGFNFITGAAGVDGRGFSLSDNNELAVQLSFTDGSAGIFRFDVTPAVSAVPEPATVGLLVGVVVFAVALRSRRRRR